ncbi:MAG: uroporphyrinogen-III synthase [Acidobacteria bacterium]|nr:uroporphyrinogen-III synthase [Acidobacteriota bacterium]
MKSNASKTPPLAGKRVLVTRARRQAGALSGVLRKLGATVIEIPAIEIRPPRSFRPLDRALLNLSRYDWLILTSVNGVEALLARMKKLAIPVRRLHRIRIAAIGPATRRAIEARGPHVQVMPQDYVAEAVVRALRRRVRGLRVLLVRAAVARDVIPSELRQADARVDVVAAYRTVTPAGSALRLRTALNGPGRKPDCITFTSSSTARNFVAMVGSNGLQKLTGVKLASIGPVTSATLRELGLRAHIEAKAYTIAELAKAIAKSV